MAGTFVGAIEDLAVFKVANDGKAKEPSGNGGGEAGEKYHLSVGGNLERGVRRGKNCCGGRKWVFTTEAQRAQRR